MGSGQAVVASSEALARWMQFVGGYRAGGTARFVILRRENALRKIVSTAVARATGRFHRHAGEGAPPQPQTPVRVRIGLNEHFMRR